MPKGFLFIVTLFDITLKLTQPTSKTVDKLEGFLNAEKGRETLIINRNQELPDTPKICFDTFGPMTVVVT